jgi:hypothetical protein
MRVLAAPPSPGMEKAVRMADRDYVECVLFYQFADSRTHPVEEVRTRFRV